MKPFLKWAGGKRQLLKSIIPIIDEHLSPKATYYEPFLGGGAVFFSIGHPYAHINDLNDDLINCYEVIRYKPNELIKLLKNHKENHEKENQKEYYYEIRKQDRDLSFFSSMTKVEKAARIIYLNKTCYNGLYRVNRKGEFNTPIGYYKNPNIADEENILQIHEYLKNNNIDITSQPFEKTVKTAVNGDFVYFDPPYDYEGKGFTTYTKEGFNHFDLQSLKDCADELIEKGCVVLISNNDTFRVRKMFDDEKYVIIHPTKSKRYDIKSIQANRNINSKGQERQKVEEVLILGKK